jgi:hypothetical protein
MSAAVGGSATASTASQSTAAAPSGSSSSSTRDQYRFPQRCPVRPSHQLNRTAKIC